MDRIGRSLALIALLALAWSAAPAPAADAPDVLAGCELDFRPYCFTAADGRPAGLGPDLLAAVAQRMGLRLQITAAPWDEVWSRLTAGELDVLPVVARTPGREPLVDFCLPHTETFDAFFVHRSRPALPDLAAAAGKEIVVLRSDAAHHELVERDFSGTVIPVESIPDGLRLVAEGRHDAFLCSKLIGTLEVEEHGIGGLAAGPPIPDYKRVFSFAVRKGDAELVEKLNQGLRIVKTSGEYDQIYARWLGQPEAPPPSWWHHFWQAAGILGLLVGLVLAWQVARRAAVWDARLLQVLAPRRNLAPSPAAGYALALVAVAAATALRWALIPWLGTIDPYNVWVVAAAGVTALLGLGPGLLFALLGMVAVEVFVLGPPPAILEAAALARMGFTCLVGIVVCVLIHVARVAAARSQQSEERYRSLFEGSLDAVFALDDAGRFLTANPAAARLSGYSVKELQARNFAELCAPDRVAATRAAFTGVSAGVPTQIETAVIRKDGRRLELLVSAAPTVVGGRSEGIFGVAADITDRKRAEAALRASEEKYRNLFENMIEEVHFWQLVRDRAGGIETWRLVDANPPALRTWGRRSVEEIRGKTADEIFGPGATEHYLPVVARIFAENAPHSFDDYFPNLDKYFRFTSVPLGEFFITTGADISAIKRAEQALRESDQRFRLALRNAPVSVAVQNRELRYIWAYNQRPARSEEILGRTDHEIFTPSEAAHITARKERVLADGVELRERMWLERPGGRVYLDFCWEPVRDRAGDIVGVATATTDLTPLKQAEEAVRAANEQLERKVRERTEELAARAEQLRALASELTLAEQRERRRLAAVLHDNLQQLLVGAKFQLTSLSRSPDEAARRIASQVEDLLDASIECSRSLTGELSPPILHEAGLVAGLEWLAVWMQQKHGLSVELTTDAAAAPDSEDMTVLLFQSVRELLFNVAKHARVKTAEVALRAVNEHLEITVSDHGVGFDPAAAGRRGDRSGGFGLFSIRERLGLLGGEMEIDSAPERGSRFTLRAPRRSSAAAEARQPATTAGVRISHAGPLPPRAAVGAPAAGTIRVLLVDDHVVVRQGLSHLLREEPDMEVVGEASDGRSALEMVRRFLPDVVTMDLHMPGMDGIETTRLIRAEFPGVQVIGLSMFEQSERAQAMREAGAASYLTKSGPSEALLAAVRACAGTGAADAAGPRAGDVALRAGPAGRGGPP